eukprot:TRINITY_DN127_c0_g1_i2.p1 TRINITY_DN127_c0_g1~~TRINITY_DN127_c0_g1_i2.p1  ORF type:complete len:305 (+),score=64.42 TRINITY_DN127_c0_g1_i2:530-1444(+)
MIAAEFTSFDQQKSSFNCSSGDESQSQSKIHRRRRTGSGSEPEAVLSECSSTNSPNVGFVRTAPTLQSNIISKPLKEVEINLPPPPPPPPPVRLLVTNPPMSQQIYTNASAAHNLGQSQAQSSYSSVFNDQTQAQYYSTSSISQPVPQFLPPPVQYQPMIVQHLQPSAYFPTTGAQQPPYQLPLHQADSAAFGNRYITSLPNNTILVPVSMVSQQQDINARSMTNSSPMFQLTPAPPVHGQYMPYPQFPSFQPTIHSQDTFLQPHSEQVARFIIDPSMVAANPSQANANDGFYTPHVFPAQPPG